MFKVLSIMLLNTRQGIKEKTFWVVGFFFVFLLGFSIFLGELSIGEKEVVLRNVVLSSIEISCLLLIIFGLVRDFYREKDSHLTEVYLSYFSHACYLGGKLIGYILICLIYVLSSTILAGLLLFLNKAFLWQILLGSLGIFMKLSIFCAVCLFFASVFDYPLLASISTVFFYIASEFSDNAIKIVSISGHEHVKLLVNSLYRILPNADKIDLKLEAIYGEPVSLCVLANVVFYVFIYVLFSYILAVLVFLRKEH